MTVRVEVPLIHYSHYSVSDLLRVDKKPHISPKNSRKNDGFSSFLTILIDFSLVSTNLQKGASRFCDSMPV